jgi:hypothetical protein
MPGPAPENTRSGSIVGVLESVFMGSNGPDPENGPLLDDDDDEDGLYPQVWRQDQPMPPNPHADLPVYTTIHRIHREIKALIDDPYSLEQLQTPRLNYLIVRPMVDDLYDRQDVSVIYCLMCNRLQFLREQVNQAYDQSVNYTRAQLCEIIAMKLLRRFDEDHEGPRGLLKLANVLVAGFEPFQGAPIAITRVYSQTGHWSAQRRAGYERKLPALELAIISECKLFLATPACQKVIDAIYQGRIVYTPSSFLDILPDHFKHKPITLYDPREAPLLDQYRLVVPRTRNMIEVGQFIILLTLYVLVMRNRNDYFFDGWEVAFTIFAFGWVLEQFATILEHGWTVYTQNLWSFLDVMFAFIYSIYLVMRLRGVATDNPEMGRQALDILAMGAPILIPRLAFNFMSENMLFLSLRAMMANFTMLTFLAVWCFGGFLLSMMWLSSSSHPPITISKWMLWIWFGLDGTGIQRSVDFHWLLGPCLMVTFAFLGNTLFITILVSMLSNTFSSIAANAGAEIQFRRAVLTFEGVKSDAIFLYLPPCNILALFLMLPLKFILTPRWFHKCNVAVVRVLNAPLLLLIGWYERRSLWVPRKHLGHRIAAQKSLFSWDLSQFSVHADVTSVFDSDPPQDVIDDIEDAERFVTDVLQDEFKSSIRNRERRMSQASNQDQHRPDPPTFRPGAGNNDEVPQKAPVSLARAVVSEGTETDDFINPVSNEPAAPSPRKSLIQSKTLSRPKPLSRSNTTPNLLDDAIAAESESSSIRPTLKKRRTRLGSVSSTTGITEDLIDILQHSSGSSNSKARLEALETSTKRIEIMLRRVVEALGQEVEQAGSSGTRQESLENSRILSVDEDDD